MTPDELDAAVRKVLGKRPSCDRLWLFLLTALAIGTLALISAGAIFHRIPNDSQTLLGVIVGGLMLFARECVQAVRSFWQDERVGRMSDHLAASAPQSDTPQPVKIEQPPDQPVPVEERP